MTDRPHELSRPDLGAYVLGALAPDERARLEAHLERCDACRAELADLAPLPGLLARLDPDVVEVGAPPPPPGPTLEEALARLGTRRRARRRTAGRLVAAAAAAVLATGGLVVVRDGGDDDLLRFATAQGDVEALVDERGWGMAVEFRASSLPRRDGYALVAVADDGHRAPVATWARAGERVRLDGSCYLDPDDVDRLEVVAGGDDADVLAVLATTNG